MLVLVPFIVELVDGALDILHGSADSEHYGADIDAK